MNMGRVEGCVTLVLQFGVICVCVLHTKGWWQAQRWLLFDNCVKSGVVRTKFLLEKM